MAYFRTGRPPGRRPIFDKPMTGAERMRRYRWAKAFFKGISDRWRVRHQVNWYRDGRPEIIAQELADCCFDWEHHKANYARWNEIHSNVLKRLAELEDNFCQFRHVPKTRPGKPKLKDYVSIFD